MSGGQGDAASASSLSPTIDSSTPVATTVAPAVGNQLVPAAAPASSDPVAPWVDAAQGRRTIPYWAVPVLALLPLWAVIYALTLDTATPAEPGPIDLGAEVYAGKGCSGCHGIGGAGAGAVPALNGVVTDFARPADMVAWVALGTAGFKAAGIDEYAPGKSVGPEVMQPWGDTLTAEELMSVVLHERVVFGGEDGFDAEVWEDGWGETLDELLPERAADYTAVLEEWTSDPPT